MDTMGDDASINPATTGTIKKKKDDKHRRRDPKSWENIKKFTLAMTEEERLAYLAKMYEEMYNENRVLYANLQARDKQVLGMQKESDRDRVELTKSILARGQLESLCRELQKQNKLIKEENVARIKEEEDRRREVANTFTERLNALTNLITESKDKSNKVKEENQNMTEKLTELYEQYQQRENHLETVTKQLDLQKKLAETQAKKTEIEHEAERQTYLVEKKALLVQLEQYEREIVLLQEKNRSLEAQVDLYKSQYSDFETTMTKSNKVFDTFKEEMSRMNKQLHALESERNDLKKRWQSSVNSLIVLSEQHVALSNEQSALEKRLAMLQKLCRQLQEDRSAFLKQLKENNIEPVVPSVKNNESSENDASEQNSGASKSNQRALKLKQELGKAKEVAALIQLGQNPPVDENTATDDQDRAKILSQGFESIQNQIESSGIQISQYLDTDGASSNLTQSEADSTVAGPSSQDPKVLAETGTQIKVVLNQELGVQLTTDTASQPDSSSLSYIGDTTPKPQVSPLPSWSDTTSEPQGSPQPCMSDTTSEPQGSPQPCMSDTTSESQGSPQACMIDMTSEPQGSPRPALSDISSQPDGSFSSDLTTQSEIFEVLDSDEEEELANRRAQAAMDLFREATPSQLTPNNTPQDDNDSNSNFSEETMPFP